MLKSPEEYLSSLNFSEAWPDGEHQELNNSERAFVEKYLGLDALDSLPEIDPEPVLQPLPKAVPLRPVLVKSPEIIIAPVPDNTGQTRHDVPSPVILKAPPQPVIEVSPVIAVVENIVQPTAKLATDSKPEQAHDARTISVDTPASRPADVGKVQTARPVDSPAAATGHLAQSVQQAPETTLRDRLRMESEIQVVSFFVAGQLFLLPVEGIQEVLRQMELVKVPQAPPFVAGVINLRGRVTPLVHLSALLTNETAHTYSERSFIIISGTDDLQLGLIIDKVNSMHMVPQKKIIWNAESKLGEAAEFLCAIVDLDDKVCGMVAPEAIVQKILPNIS